MKRLQHFLASDEQSEIKTLPAASQGPCASSYQWATHQFDAGEMAVHMKGDFAWNRDSEPCLRNLDVQIASGSVTAIVGPTGSGKTSFLSSIIGLTQSVSGSPPVVHGRLALVPQSPFILDATVRENILFGQEYESVRYAAAIQASALGPDLQAFPWGDETLLGERGINISGGQKQRIALARAVYSDADVFLLDDPLSALDANVMHYVFRECLLSALKGKTLLLVTHHLPCLSAVDQILCIRNGRVRGGGDKEELMQMADNAMMLDRRPSPESTSKVDHPDAKPSAEHHDSIPDEPARNAALYDATVNGIDGSERREQEHRSVGITSISVFRSYAHAMGGVRFLLLIVALAFLSEISYLSTDLWLAHWTHQGESAASHGNTFYAWIYILLGFLKMLVIFAEALLFGHFGRIASASLHRNMLTRLLRVPMRFYQTTPKGQILNRLTKDMTSIDRVLVSTTALALAFAHPFLLSKPSPSAPVV